MDQYAYLWICNKLTCSNYLIVDYLNHLHSHFALQHLRVRVRLVHAGRNLSWSANLEFLLGCWILHLHPGLSEASCCETRYSGEFWLDLRYRLTHGWILTETTKYVVKLLSQILLGWRLRWSHTIIHHVEQVVGTLRSVVGRHTRIKQVACSSRCGLSTSWLRGPRVKVKQVDFAGWFLLLLLLVIIAAIIFFLSGDTRKQSIFHFFFLFICFRLCCFSFLRICCQLRIRGQASDC